ncbi:acyl-CoA dehydratase activase [Desulfocurvibacter africanus]|uniref:CoA-substrate-specific enzyme activase n=1 Tax=Desulfocurvibacter africanus subsp. africanus str. Walvis Bay TaxID=690850 RepID=F3YYB3_DESAF|nr:acyl-CoA dehydratase activase [Desulfocurvibacter africanus]EGJ49557.1 CoA-substrate-specific enzyme activase [Desulfocurvibacter africanus subsp. africanus str. Walvis Bay]
MLAGIDAGSVSIKVALLDSQGAIVAGVYERHGGHPLERALDILDRLSAEYPGLLAACTGSAGRRLATLIGCPHYNELAAFALSSARLLPGVRSVFEMGGEDSKLMLLDGHGSLKDFALNSVCAAGTGSFLDQQAERMRLSIEEFAALALQSENPPRIAGRCSVFAKSDMIHLQQIGSPLEDIVAGLCFSVARNFKGAIVRGRPVERAVAFMGGVALNRGVVRAFREVFDLAEDELVVPEHPTLMGAIGAGFKAQAEGAAKPMDLEVLRLALADNSYADPGQPPLLLDGDEFAARHLAPVQDKPAPASVFRLYMGIDVGSISTNLALMDEADNLVAKRYLRTASRPIEAVRQGLAEIEAELKEKYGMLPEIAGVGTTGSGRYMIADFFCADVVKNEITAQAKAAAHIDPSVDTIFEIGGQDSKYISLKDGIIVDFEMNKACAAGTGSFLEEQAEKLSIAIKDEFARLALGSDSPCRLGERCTVFMENSLQASLSRGAGRDDLLAGLAYSIVENYIGRVVAGRRIGEHIFFQGGTAFNKAVVAAFEKYLGRQVTVPPDHDVTGAIGMALIAREHARGKGPSRFGGFDMARRPYSLKSFPCKGCDNLCEINRVSIEGREDKLFYGGRCEKWDIRRQKEATVPDLFAFRHQALTGAHEARRELFEAEGKPSPRGRLGLPLVFFQHDSLPYYATLLWELGFEPVVSPEATPRIVGLGVEMVLADTCFPIKAAQGHIRWLKERGLDRIFLPSFVNLGRPGDAWPNSQGCPLTQSFPYQVRAAFPELTVIAPDVSLSWGERHHFDRLRKSLAPFGVRGSELRKAMARAKEAQERFHAAIQARGREFLSTLNSRALVILGRPYNAFDMGMNLEIPRKLASLDEPCIPMDFLPSEELAGEVAADWPHMYWRSGQRILTAARYIRSHPHLFPLFIGNFSCGPDSFILKYFEEELRGHPALHLEIDEHSADAGVITRLEAFLDSLTAMGHAKPGPVERKSRGVPRPTRSRDIVMHVPRMSDHALGLVAAFRFCGVDARIMEETDDEAVALARKFVTGKECYPCAVTTGDMLKICFTPGFDPNRQVFFMPSGTGPCRFGQYNVFQRMVLERAGFGQAKVYSPEQSETFYEELGVEGSDFARKSWQAIVAISLLQKCLHETRPLEAQAGQCDALYADYLPRVCMAVERGAELESVLADMRLDFEDVERTGESKPLIGIVGEIFVRSNPFSNEQLVQAVENLGGRAWLAPVDEWIYYVAAMAKRRAVRKRDVRHLLQLAVKDFVQKRISHRYEHIFDGFLETAPEPHVGEVMRLAAPYVHISFEGEAILSVGKAVDMCRQGAAGIINAMPFGCMPGTVTTALLHPVSERFGVPTISMPFDGSRSPSLGLTLETFMEQAQARQRGERGGRQAQA